MLEDLPDFGGEVELPGDAVGLDDVADTFPWAVWARGVGANNWCGFGGCSFPLFGAFPEHIIRVLQQPKKGGKDKDARLADKWSGKCMHVSARTGPQDAYGTAATVLGKLRSL